MANAKNKMSTMEFVENANFEMLSMMANYGQLCCSYFEFWMSKENATKCQLPNAISMAFDME
jgi:hypothetical protein